MAAIAFLLCESEQGRAQFQPRMKSWEIIADNLSKAGWSWGCVSAVDSGGRTFCNQARNVQPAVSTSSTSRHEVLSHSSQLRNITAVATKVFNLSLSNCQYPNEGSVQL
jgi:hypothetical protein